MRSSIAKACLGAAMGLISATWSQTGSDGERVVSFGTTLKPLEQIAESQQLAKILARPNSANWRAKGDQKRTYRFSPVTVDIAYRVCVPSTWDGVSPLPLVMFLHGAGNDESSYLDQNGKQMVNLASQHGYLLVSPLGYQGAYGTFLKLPAAFGLPAEADKILATRTAETERTQSISEKDVINVLEMVLNEYPVDRSSVFLTGHSMGSGGTWYIGAKYASYWKALAPMSGPFVLETGYPWDSVATKPIFVTEGTRGTATLTSSRALRDWMKGRNYKVEYKEVDADHAGMVPLVLPNVFDFFDKYRGNAVGLAGERARLGSRRKDQAPGAPRLGGLSLRQDLSDRKANPLWVKADGTRLLRK